MQPKRILILRAGFNSHGKKDVTWAFKPEAARFLKSVCTADSKIVAIDNRKPFAQRQAEVVKVFRAADQEVTPYDGVAFFCHGWKTGIQLGFKNRDVALLADWVHTLCEHSFPYVPLYCCSTGGDVRSKKLRRTSPGTGDNSFADLLRDALCEEIAADGLAPYPRVFAHETVAHTSKNPRVRVFDGMGSSEGGVGGYRPIKVGGIYWKAWKRELREHEGDFRFRVPFMDVPDIEAELG